MRFPRILAYADSSEWQDTYEQMNTERVLGAWQTRVKSLPHAVESTFQMHAALVKLQSLTLGGGGLTATTTGVDTSPAVSAAASMHARMAASLAFIKFINGLVDPLQSGRYAASIHAIALDALPTLPTWFIDLRHQATHDPVLPSHAVLVNALSQALRWLKTEYWDVERGALLQQSHQLHLDWEQQLLKHRHHRSLVGNLALECKSHLVLYRDAVAEAHGN